VIRDLMGISLLTTAQVKSHLQKYRIRVVAETGTENATEAQVGGQEACRRHGSDASGPVAACHKGGCWLTLTHTRCIARPALSSPLPAAGARRSQAGCSAEARNH
jgi:hypothetical protein